MKKINIIGHVFGFEDSAGNFITAYLDRIDNYWQQNNISEELIKDIKYSIIEKLYIYENPIKESQVINISQTIWEPENIFGEDLNSKEKDIKKSSRWIDKDEPILRWVCYWIAKSLKIPVIWIRILFMLLLFANWIGLLIYILLAIFAPYKDKSNTTWKIWSLIFKITSACFWLFVILVLWIVISIVFFGSFVLFFTPTIDNQSITAILPSYIYWVAWGMLFSLLVLLIWSIWALFRKNWVSKNIVIFSTIMIILWWAIWIWNTYKTFVQYMSNTQTVSQSYILTGANMSDNTFYLNTASLNFKSMKSNIPNIETNLFDIPFVLNNVDIVPSTWSDIFIKIDTDIRWLTKSDLENKLKLYTPLIISWDKNTIDISSPSVSFGKEVPFAAINRNITIYIPKDKEIVADKLWALPLRTYYSDLDKNLAYTCLENSPYVYDSHMNEFICKNSTSITGAWARDLWWDFSWLND